MAKDIVSRTGEQGWTLFEIMDGFSSKSPLVVSWNLPSVINVPQGSNIGIRQWTLNSSGYTISVSGLPTGVTYNPVTEELEGAESGTDSTNATFTLTLDDIVIEDTAIVALVETVTGLPDYYDTNLVPATLWVNSVTGDDSYTRAQVLAGGGSLQWNTIGRAVWGSTSYATQNPSEAARAGDVVQIAPGIYWEGTGGPTVETNAHRFTVVLEPANDGTAEDPIIFRSDPANPAEIRLQENIRGPIIGGNHDYIFWHGFRINDYYGGSLSDTGPVHFGGGATGCRLSGCNVSGHPGTYYWGYTFTQAWVCGYEVQPEYDGFPSTAANYRLVSLEGANSCVIADNIIWRALVYRVSNCEQFALDPASTITAGHPGGANEVCIMTYNAHNNIYEHNLLKDSGGAIFIKGNDNNDNIVRFNKTHNTGNGVRVLSGARTLVYQNLFYGSSPPYYGWGDANEGSRWINNTIVSFDDVDYSTETPIIISSNLTEDHVWMNNIVKSASSRNEFYNGNAPFALTATFDRNIYYRTPSWNESMTYNWNSGSPVETRTQWVNDGRDINSLFQTDPLFVDELTQDYRLQAESPALTLGRDYLNLTGNGTESVIPAGCYITGDEILGPRIEIYED